MERTADPVSSALETVVARFAAMVRAVGRQHHLPVEDLDEVLQEVRIRLWRAHGTGEHVERLGASYVYRTATSAALDLLRRRRARGAGVTERLEDHLHALPPDPHAPHRALEQRELAGRIMDAVETLPDARRAAVRMHLSGYGRDEIAELLGWSEARTRNLLYRGLADLRARLAARGIGMDDTQ
jgi:RNA polymerase sigma-70 factor (ECF subfamily)